MVYSNILLDSAKKKTFVWDKMSPNMQRQGPLGLSNPRSSVTLLIITMLIVYVLYSFNIILQKDHKCSIPSSEISTKERLVETSLSPPSNSSLTNSNKEEMSDNFVSPSRIERDDTKLKHIVFGIAASSNLWDDRKEYIKLWWRPEETRGVVWLDKNVAYTKDEGLPEIQISGDTSEFQYTNVNGDRSALRISRVISETLRLGMEDVRWFVMGDDDTVFIVENLVRVLSKYDHKQFYYIGSISESHIQDIHFSYAMAYGGGGFAISYPLAKELEHMQDQCIQRYPGLYGSDDRIQACMAELGVPLTRETGFHQYDVYGNLLGLLGAHPVTPFLSIHHLEVVDPIFPDMNRIESLKHLFVSARYDSASLMQQSICYDKRRLWSISVSWGYAVQIFRGVISPRELEMPARTFLNWYKEADYTAYSFNTRPEVRHPCQKPFVFYMTTTRYDRQNNQVIGIYSIHKESRPDCPWRGYSPEIIDSVVVTKSPDSHRWQKSPRRDCCRLMQTRRRATLHIWVKNCDEGEFSEL